MEANVEEMKQIIHDEKMAVRKAKLKPIQEAIRKQNAFDEKLFSKNKHWSGSKATVTDYARSIDPPRSKILEELDRSTNRLEAHYYGIRDGLFVRMGIIAILWFFYVFT